jgi:hypothetical protein
VGRHWLPTGLRTDIAGSFRALATGSLVLLWLFGACCARGRPDPKDTLKGMFAAMEGSDSLSLVAQIDLASAAQSVRGDLDSATATGGRPDWGGLLLASLTGEGRLRKRWLENQIVLGESQVLGDSALVEVSFLDRLTRVQYYNKMRLVYRDGRWVVTSFRTM